MRAFADAAPAVARDLPRGNPGSEIVALFIESVNDVIDLRERRVMVRERGRIPGPFWAVLCAIAILVPGAMGYHVGVAGTSRSPAMLAVAFASSAVIMMVADLDRPGEGLVNVSQQAMIDLRDSMAEPKP